MTSPATTEAHSDRKHSSVVGGSNADQRLNCPASYRLEQQIDEKVRNKSSSFADEGTALHEAMAYALQNDVQDPEELLGMSFDVDGTAWVITRELVDECLAPCFDFLEALEEELEAEGGVEWIVERQVRFPGIEGAFGTGDLTGRTAKRTILIDWKFGAGKPVKAVYREQDGSERVNSQLLFYGRATLHTLPEMFGDAEDDWPVDLYIMQPRSGDGLPQKAEVCVGDLKDFEQPLINAVDRAMNDPTAPTRKGPWCEFKACKLVCPLYVGAILDLSKVNKKNLVPTSPSAEVIDQIKGIDWSYAYARLIELADHSEEIIGEIRKQAHAYMDAGGVVTGYKLVPKRATEKYTDEEGAKKFAKKLGLKDEDLMTKPELKSPAQLGKALEPIIDKKIPTKKAREEAARKAIANFTEKVSSGTNIAPADDKRPDVIPIPTLVQDLAKRLGVAVKS